MKSILITGAGKGLGRELAVAFCKVDWRVYPFVRTAEDGTELSAMSEGNCRPIVGDIRDEETGARIQEGLSHRSLDVVINNAGVPATGPHLEEVNPSSIVELVQVHCLGALRCVQACLPLLRSAPAPLVVNITSRLGSITRNARGDFKGEEHSYAYRIAKAAQNMLTACLAVDSTMRGITVVAVHPGRMSTQLSQTPGGATPATQAGKLCKLIVNGDLPHGRFLDLDGGEIEW